VSEKQRFAVRDLLEIFDNETGTIIATAVSRNRAIMISAALNAAYCPAVELEPQPAVADVVYAADQYRVVRHSYGDSGLGVYRVMSPSRIVATCENVSDARQICDRLNDANPKSET
jgi:hypothetical protein